MGYMSRGVHMGMQGVPAKKTERTGSRKRAEVWAGSPHVGMF